MLFPSLLSRPHPAMGRPSIHQHRVRPQIEALEDRFMPSVYLSISDAEAVEGHSTAGSAVFVVTLSAPADGPVTVRFQTADGTARKTQDYQAASGKLTFAPGETSKTISIAITDDTKVEGNEHFLVKLFDAVGALIQDGEGYGGIYDDDFRSDRHDRDRDNDGCRGDRFC